MFVLLPPEVTLKLFGEKLAFKKYERERERERESIQKLYTVSYEKSFPQQTRRPEKYPFAVETQRLRFALKHQQLPPGIGPRDERKERQKERCIIFFV